MVQLLKIKEHIYRFIGKYEIYTIAVFRFLVAFAAFTLINQKIGYMDLLKEYPIPLLFALLCSFLPSGMMLFLGAVLILLNCYALSLELCGIVALIFVILFCIYFRFFQKKRNVCGVDAGAWRGRNPIRCSGGIGTAEPGVRCCFCSMWRDGILFIEEYQ